MIDNTVQLDNYYVKIENLKQFLLKEIPKHHPDDPRYKQFWSYETAKCIEGVWGKMFGKYRYMSGNLYFYGNHTEIQTTNIFKETVWIKPKIRTFEWEIDYYLMECQGFSGWELDEEYTSDERWFDFRAQAPNFNEIVGTGEEVEAIRSSVLTLYNSKGELKKYRTPEESIKTLHDKPLGAPLFFNEARNGILFGSRGGGKSYYLALGRFLHYLLFDGSKRYDDKFLDGLIKAEICIGSANKDKSSDFCAKIEDCLIRMKINPELGAWGKETDVDYAPSPLYREFKGSIGPNNKENPFEYAYEALEHGRKITKGTLTKLFHVVYSSNKKDAAQSAAGGRYNLLGYEEAGLMSNLIDAWGSNKSTVERDGNQIGTQMGWGTSGNIEQVQSAKKIMLNPQDYNVVSREDIWERAGKDGRIGFFLTYLLTLDTIDKDGNVIWQKAIEKYNKKFESISSSADPKMLVEFKMNHPVVPSDMWTTNTEHLLPRDEALTRERELMANNHYKELGNPVDLIWDDSKQYRVRYEINHISEPITQFPIDAKKMTDPSGVVMLYEEPEMIKGVIPSDMYSFVGHDPYVAEELDKGGSVGVTYILKNPKYIANGHTGNIIVASYIGKPIGGLKVYYSVQEKLIALFGNPPRGLWYESDRGEYCRGYYLKKNKEFLLAIAPQIEQGDSIYQKNIVRYGFRVGNRINKLHHISLLNEWLLEDTTFIKNNKEETKKNIFRIPCLFFIRQVSSYNLVDNFDAISGIVGCVLGLREYEAQIESTLKKRSVGNSLKFLSTNSSIMEETLEQKLKKFRKNYGQKVPNSEQLESYFKGA